MIQLSNRKKLIILASVILIVIISIVISILVKNKKTVTPAPTVVTPTQPIVRDMTREEKINVGISPAQEAEVVNDKNGLYIYRIKK